MKLFEKLKKKIGVLAILGLLFQTAMPIYQNAAFAQEEQGIEQAQAKASADEDTNSETDLDGDRSPLLNEETTEEGENAPEIVDEEDSEDESEEIKEDIDEKKTTEENEEEVKVLNSKPETAPFATGKDLGNIFNDIKLFQNKEEIVDGNTIEIDDGTEIGMQLDWKLKDSIDLKAGDYAEIAIPDVFDTSKIPNGTLKDGDTKLGTYSFEEGTLKVVFNDELVDKDNRQGTVGFDMKFDLNEFDDEIEKEIKFGDPISKSFTVRVDVNGEDVEKTGELEEGANPKYIDWTIDVNTNLDSLTNAKVKDATPEGLKLDFESIEVYELKVDRHGNATLGDQVENPGTEETDNGFIVNLGDTNKAYRIKHRTEITDYDVDGYINEAVLEVNGENKAEDDYKIDKIEIESLIEKAGKIKDNPKYITWTIDINKREESLDNAKVEDTLPDGLTLKEITIYDLKYDGGDWKQDGKAEFNKFTEFPLELGDIENAYQIVVETAIDFDEINSLDNFKDGVKYVNEATLTADNDIEDSAEDEVTAKWDKLVTKTGEDVTKYGDREMEWTVTLNKAELEINNAKFVDLVGPGQELIEDSIEVSGKETYEIEYNNFDDWKLGLPEVVEGFKKEDITFGIDFGTLTEKVKVTYRTKITDLEIEDGNYTNRALLFGSIGSGTGIGPGKNNPYLEDHKDGGSLSVKNKYSKTAKGINYEDKTMSWEIVADAVEEEIKKLTITDTFDPEKSMFLVGELEVFTGDEKDNKLTEGKDYELTDHGVKGFKIEFTGDHKPLKRTKYTIEFETSFNPDEVLIKDGELNDSKTYQNNAKFKGETETIEDLDLDKDDEQELKDWISKKGRKEGTLNRDNRSVSWKVFTNPLGQDLTGEEFKIEDTLTKGQVFDEESLEVYEYSLGANGEVIKSDDPIDSDYDLTETDEGFTLTFSDGIDKPVMLVFDSQIKGLSEEEYTNTAAVTGKDIDESYSDTVEYEEHDKFVDKNSDIDGDIAYTDSEIEWSVTVNDSLSDIKSAVFRDTISSGQILINDSIELNGEKVDEDKLTIKTNDEGETEVELELGDIHSIQKITYKTVVTASEGQISNNASLYGNDKDLGDSSGKDYTAESAPWGTGSGDERVGRLEIVKVDEEGETITLPAEFELYYEINEKKQIVTGENQTTEDGKIQYGNLPFRTYYLKEMVAPAGYEVSNDAPEDYKLTEDGYIKIDLNNEKRDIKLDIENKKIKTEVMGRKIWQDDNDATNYRPQSITVQLLQNGTEFKSKEVTAASDWSYTFSDLDEYDDEGNQWEYTVDEVQPDGYIKTAGEGYNLVNTRTGRIDVAGEKIWRDGNSSNRPDSIDIELKRKIASDADYSFVKEMTVSSTDDWTYEFNNLEEFDADGIQYDYIVKEKEVPSGYRSSFEIDKDGNYNIINTRTGSTSVSGEKIWMDDAEADRPASIKVNLLIGNRVIRTKEVTADDNWEYSFTGLSRYDGSGRYISYSVQEQPVPGYESKVDGYDIINTRSDTTSIKITKDWLNSELSERPNAVTVDILRNDEIFKTVEVKAADDWIYELADLDAYDDTGQAYVYRLEEEALPGYKARIDGYNITNEFQGFIDITVNKIWENDTEDDRPDSISVDLIQNGEVIESVDLTKANGWTYQFENLDQFDQEGLAYEYSLTEEKVEGYISSIETTADGFEIVNTYDESSLPEGPEEPEEPEDETPDQDADDPEDGGTESEGPSDFEEESGGEGSGKLPQTGEASSTIFTLIGMGFILIGLGFGKKRYKQ